MIQRRRRTIIRPSLRAKPSATRSRRCEFASWTRIRPRKRSGRFSPAEELRNLAPRIASGLAKAGPRQDVTFSTIGSHPRAAGGLVKDPGVNAGRVFYDDGKINVIFGELQSGYRKRNVYGQRTEDFTPRQQGSRTKAAEHEWALAARPGVELHSNAGGVRNDWVEIDARSCRIGRSGCVAGAGGSDASSSNSSGIRGRTRGDEVRRGPRATPEDSQGAPGQEPDQRRGLPREDAGVAVRALNDEDKHSRPCQGTKG